MKIEKTPDGYLLSKDICERIELWRRFDGVESWACEAIDELIAERDALRAALQHEADCVEAAKAAVADLRAKIEAMEKQEPSHWGCTVLQSDGRWKEEVSREAPPEGWFSVRDIFPLYAHPGAQSAPSKPAGWLRAIDEALVVTHLGVANESDTHEQAKAKLNSLVRFHVDAATHPAVNGGWKLVPIVSTAEMDKAGSEHCDGYLSTAEAVWDAMLAAAPEAKR